MKPKIGSLSVFFPSVNEEENIETTINQAVTVLNKLNIEYEILIIDDGSTDQTGKIAEQLAKKSKKIKVIHHEKNLGYGSALKTGFKHARYPWVAFADSDGQFDFSEIRLLLEKTENVDLVLGYRLKRADSLLRKVYTYGWSMLAKILLGLDARDYSCGFKLIKKEVFNAVLPLEGEEKVTQIELLVKAKRLGFKSIDVGVHHYPRIYGKPTGAKVSVVLKSVFDLFRLWWQIKEEKRYFFVLIAILSIGAFLRFYRLPEYMTFLGDEGRDALIIRSLLLDFNLPFIGPPTSVGNIYLGPLYYYMMGVTMAIFGLNPIAAAGMVAFIGVLTILIIYYLTKTWFGRLAGLVAAFLYAISPVTIIYSRSSWNPNPAPFFTLIGMYGLYKAHKTHQYFWLILVGLAASAAIQMHYLALILLPIYALVWIYELWDIRSLNLKTRNFFVGTIGALIGFILLLFPLILFDFKHNFLNYRAITALFSSDKAVTFNLIETLLKIPQIYPNNLIGRYLTGENSIMTLVVMVVSLIPFLAYFFSKKKSADYWPYLLLGIWLVVGLIGLSFYKSTLFDHYLGFINPVPFILFGCGIAIILNHFRSTKYLILSWTVIAIILIVLTYLNLQKTPLLQSPNQQVYRTQEVARFIIEKARGKPFNFALISAHNYDAAYQFYLYTYGSEPKQVPTEITEQLFVVCEDGPCQPIYSPKYEIAGYGWSKVAQEYEVSGVKVYRLVPNEAMNQN